MNLSGGVIEGIDVSSDEVGTVLRSSLAGVKLDALINNAGILNMEQLDQLCAEDNSACLASIRRQFEINTLGPLKVTTALVGAKILESGSKVGIVTSLMGSIADNGSGGMYG